MLRIMSGREARIWKKDNYDIEGSDAYFGTNLAMSGENDIGVI